MNCPFCNTSAESVILKEGYTIKCKSKTCPTVRRDNPTPEIAMNRWCQRVAPKRPFDCPFCGEATKFSTSKVFGVTYYERVCMNLKCIQPRLSGDFDVDKLWRNK